MEEPPPTTGADTRICAEIGTWTFTGIANLTCDDPDAHISHVDFADYGTPTGSCGAYVRESSCSTHLLTKALVLAKCYGKRSCSIDKLDLPGIALPGLGSYGPQPCPALELTNLSTVLQASFRVEARCSKGGGTGTGSLHYGGKMVYAAAFARQVTHGGATTEERRVLMINKGVNATNACAQRDSNLPPPPARLRSTPTPAHHAHAPRARPTTTGRALRRARDHIGCSHLSPSVPPPRRSLVGLGARKGTLYSVEPNGAYSSPDGIATRPVLISGGSVTLELAPFAVAMLKLEA